MNAPTKILPAPQKEVGQVFPHRQLDQFECLLSLMNARQNHYESARGALLSGRSGLNLVQAARALFGDDLHELALNIGAEIGVVPTEDL